MKQLLSIPAPGPGPSPVCLLSLWIYLFRAFHVKTAFCAWSVRLASRLQAPFKPRRLSGFPSISRLNHTPLCGQRPRSVYPSIH